MPSPHTQNSRRSWRLLGAASSLLLTAALLGASLYIALHRQLALDWISYMSYQPTSAMSALAERIHLTDDGYFTFYATRPEINDSTTFNAKCGRKEQNTAILGCYANNKIHIYDVKDKRLDGIKQVTAAHEMLHAVYQRLSEQERARIDELVQAEYEKLQLEPSLAERMAFYARTEPGERNNELHSIIGTEVKDISGVLEAHYAKYLDDRDAILALYDSYNGEFRELEDQADQLSAQLELLSAQIDSASTAYNEAIVQLRNDVSDFNARATAGDFSSQAEFDTERSQLIARSSAITEQRSALNELIERYNASLRRYNDTVTQSQNLYKSIDSTLSPVPAI